jgi:hypothetical protein
MSVIGYRKLAILLLILLLALLFYAFHVQRLYFGERTEIHDLSGTLEMYEGIRNRLPKMSANDDMECLFLCTPRTNQNSKDKDYAIDLVQKQETDRIINDLIIDLRKKTGENLGDDPEAWLKKYGYDATNAASFSPSNK